MKKYMKIASIVMTLVLVMTSAAFISTTSLEAKSQVKSITVKGAKKKLTLNVGNKKTYKVTVKAKKSKTGFDVKSSNKKVVKVKKKGNKVTITALKVGTAKVTIRASKDKKKKYVIKITVKRKKQQETTKPVQPTAVPVETTTVAPVETTTSGQLTTEDSIGGFDQGAGDNIDDLIETTHN